MQICILYTPFYRKYCYILHFLKQLTYSVFAEIKSPEVYSEMEGKISEKQKYTLTVILYLTFIFFF